ncbi:hypothetical protein G7Z17_g10750 [Cylindrodendrum hubeiense]|uniref:Uncharacterized protein n=1 Tax=Cylindrodendrum hubeiense TaxID=595255 RepID=A0A9P5H0X3_9HYPO|nr:hypothetical protein G7Z17_g10750 [Cylindrodendrum hubeiense]
MRVLPALFFICALAPVTHTFEFTAPDTSKPINFSEPVVFKWPIVEGVTLEPWLQLIFATGDSGQTGRWGINLETIDTRNDSTWTWDVPEWVEVWTEDDSKQFLAAGTHNWFEASLSRLRDSNETMDGTSVVTTEKFEIVGYPYLKEYDSGAGATTPSLSLALAVGAIMLIFGLTP